MIRINGQDAAWAEGMTVAEAVVEFGATGKGIAVALNRDVVPRSAWESTRIEAGCEIEIVSAAAGG